MFAGKNPGGGTVENIYQTKKKISQNPEFTGTSNESKRLRDKYRALQG